MFDIIVPVYKTPLKLLKGCLDSINNQTFNDYTVWICDGTPNDWMRYEKMQDLFLEYPKFKIIKQEGEGVSQARNQIIRMGNNPYVAFLDSDDYWTENYLEQVYKRGILENQDDNINIWFCEISESYNEIHEFNLDVLGITETIGIDIGRERILQRYDILNFIPLENQIHFHVNAPLWFSGTVFERVCLEKTDLFDEKLKYGEDTTLLINCIEQGGATQYLPFLGAYRNNHEGQITKDESNINNDWHSELKRKIWVDDEGKSTNYHSFANLTSTQKNVLLRYLEDGRIRGITHAGCSENISLMSEEDLEIEKLG